MRLTKTIPSLAVTCFALFVEHGTLRGQSNTAVADSAVSIGFQNAGGAVVAAGVGLSFQSGGISVTTNLAAATFTIAGPVTYIGGGTDFSQPNAPPGPYTITFGAVTGYTTPGQQNQTLSVGGTITFVASYTSVLPPASSLGVSPASLAFWYQQGASTPKPQNVSVSSSEAVSFTAASITGSGGAWLSVSPTSGTTGTSSGTLAISVSPQSLKVGAYTGKITITSTEPAVTLPVILTVTPSTPVTRVMTLKTISGWSAKPEVANAEWLGQPDVGQPEGPPNSGQYYLAYAIDTCQASSPCPTENTQPAVVNPSWTLMGTGFCPTTGCQGIPGTLVFSDPAIMPVVFPAKKVKGMEWDSSSITFTPSFAPNVSFQYTYHNAVLVTITALDGATQTLNLPIPGSTPDCTVSPCNIVSTIDTRGYGQCTWFVANQRLSQGRPIPYPAYQTTSAILPSKGLSCNSSDQCYTPQEWDVIDFVYGMSTHTAIILPPVKQTTTPQADGNTLITYTFTIGEMNVGTCPPGGGTCKVSPWSEQPSATVGCSYCGKFEVLQSPAGVQTLSKGILSFYSKTKVATAYFR